MLGKIIDLKIFKHLSKESEFMQWLYAARELRWKLNSGKYPIYLEYKVNPIPRYGYGKPAHKLIYEKFKESSSKYEEIIKKFAEYRGHLGKISVTEPENNAEPFWKNGWVEGLDPIAIYCFPCMLKSNLYVEIGSGNSTKFIRKGIQDNNLKTKVVSIDPQPRAEIDNICDEVIRQPLEKVDIKIFDDLGNGDILMVDNSHRCFQNSDVTTVFLDILPRLSLIHI